MIRCFAVLALLLSGLTVQGDDAPNYGVDCSFPIHYKDFRCGDILGDRKTFYENFMQGCRDYYKKKGYLCNETEESRLEMSLRQPQSMVVSEVSRFAPKHSPSSERLI